MEKKINLKKYVECRADRILFRYISDLLYKIILLTFTLKMAKQGDNTAVGQTPLIYVPLKYTKYTGSEANMANIDTHLLKTINY